MGIFCTESNDVSGYAESEDFFGAVEYLGAARAKPAAAAKAAAAAIVRKAPPVAPAASTTPAPSPKAAKAAAVAAAAAIKQGARADVAAQKVAAKVAATEARAAGASAKQAAAAAAAAAKQATKQAQIQAKAGVQTAKVNAQAQRVAAVQAQKAQVQANKVEIQRAKLNNQLAIAQGKQTTAQMKLQAATDRKLIDQLPQLLDAQAAAAANAPAAPIIITQGSDQPQYDDYAQEMPTDDSGSAYGEGGGEQAPERDNSDPGGDYEGEATPASQMDAEPQASPLDLVADSYDDAAGVNDQGDQGDQGGDFYPYAGDEQFNDDAGGGGAMGALGIGNERPAQEGVGFLFLIPLALAAASAVMAKKKADAEKKAAKKAAAAQALAARNAGGDGGAVAARAAQQVIDLRPPAPRGPAPSSTSASELLKHPAVWAGGALAAYALFSRRPRGGRRS